MDTRVAIALDTSTRTPSIAVRNAHAVFEVELEPTRAHASDLLPALQRALESAGAQPGEIELIGVGLGPGSFTGLRVGLATVQGLARSTGARIVAVPSGAIVAHAELAPGERAVHLLDARGGTFYFSHFGRTQAGVESVVPAQLLARDDVLAALPDDTRIWVDTGARAFLAERAPDLRNVLDAPLPRAATLLEIAAVRAAAGNFVALAELEPLYLRPFAARPRRR